MTQEQNTIDSTQVQKRNQDVLFALILLVGSGALIVYALRMSLQAMSTMNATFYDAPGFSIMVISGALLVLSVALLVIARKQGGGLAWLAPKKIKQACWNRSSLQTWIVFFYLFCYMMGFGQTIPGTGIVIPFWLSTSLFLIVMMVTFRAARLPVILITSGLCTVLVYLIFGVLAKIPLP